MNAAQKIWIVQAQSDLEILLLLRRNAASPCHQLHYLQMAAEKLGKAYFWRSGRPPRRSHSSFVSFLRALGGVSAGERTRVAGALQFSRFEDFQAWLRSVLPLAYDLEKLAPALAGEAGPNPEYPWPSDTPEQAPATYDFDVWRRLVDTGRGRQLLQVVEAAVERFEEYA